MDGCCGWRPRQLSKPWRMALWILATATFQTRRMIIVDCCHNSFRVRRMVVVDGRPRQPVRLNGWLLWILAAATPRLEGWLLWMLARATFQSRWMVAVDAQASCQTGGKVTRVEKCKGGWSIYCTAGWILWVGVDWTAGCKKNGRTKNAMKSDNGGKGRGGLCGK